MVNVLLAGAISLVVSLLGTPLLIRRLSRIGYGQIIRDDLTHHHYKRGKPTMGGLVIIGSTVAGYFGSRLLLLAVRPVTALRIGPSEVTASALLVLLLMIGTGVVGFLDDYRKVSRATSLGLTSRQKLVGQVLVTVAFAVPALFWRGNGHSPASAAISFVRDSGVDLRAAGGAVGAVLFILWASVLVTGASNGVNITDGLDGLATGACALVFSAYAGMSVWQYNQSCLRVPGPSCYEVRDPLDLAVVACAAAVRASDSCGGTPLRPGSSWVTRVPWHSVPDWPASPS